MTEPEKQKPVLQKETIGWRERLNIYNERVKAEGINHDDLYEQICKTREESSDAMIKSNPMPNPTPEFKTRPRKPHGPLKAYKYWNHDG